VRMSGSMPRGTGTGRTTALERPSVRTSAKPSARVSQSRRFPPAVRSRAARASQPSLRSAPPTSVIASARVSPSRSYPPSARFPFARVSELDAPTRVALDAPTRVASARRRGSPAAGSFRAGAPLVFPQGVLACARDVAPLARWRGAGAHAARARGRRVLPHDASLNLSLTWARRPRGVLADAEARLALTARRELASSEGLSRERAFEALAHALQSGGAWHRCKQRRHTVGVCWNERVRTSSERPALRWCGASRREATVGLHKA
jgi:hypothetical protein